MKNLIIGLTGPMAAGKNAVASILEKHNCISIDADLLVHGAIEKARNTIIDTFSKQADELHISLLNPDSTINRKELAKVVFASKQNLALQESIIHPVVNTMMEEFIEQHKDKTVILNATVLYKTPVINKCNAIIFVTSPAILRFFRAKKREKISNKQIISRFLAQFNIFAKYKFLNTDTYKVRNLGSKRKLEHNVLQVLDKIYSEQG